MDNKELGSVLDTSRDMNSALCSDNRAEGAVASNNTAAGSSNNGGSSAASGKKPELKKRISSRSSAGSKKKSVDCPTEEGIRPTINDLNNNKDDSLKKIESMMQSIAQSQKELASKVDIMWNSGVDPKFEDYSSEQDLFITQNYNPHSMSGSDDEDNQPQECQPPGKKARIEPEASSSSALYADEDAYKWLAQQYDRPENCETLCQVRLNQLIWEIASAKATSLDSRMQVIQNCFAKAGTCLTHLAYRCSKLEMRPITGTDCLNEITNALAFLGHGFHGLCLRRSELLKPELRQDYAHLCSATLPYTEELFGGDIEKTVKDIRDVNKVGSHIRQGSVFTRGRKFSFSRGRGGAQSGGYNSAGNYRNLNFRRARMSGAFGPRGRASQTNQSKYSLYGKKKTKDQ
ncbi:uncharacterized protein LOC141908377 [Tubulanus polymorphus]|uniref:uncharacterized protein LOC141908377 n=1 Tax=Tubulanus polymorphus TaxID=672921 RepID=UPI003DA48E26